MKSKNVVLLLSLIGIINSFSGELTWFVHGNIPLGVSDHGAVISEEGIFYFGGGGEWPQRNESYIYQFNGITLNRSNMPEARCMMAFVKHKGKAYSLGGYLEGTGASNRRKEVFSYDLLEDNWTIETSLSFERDNSGAVSIGDYIYIVGGHNQGIGALNNVERYNTDLSGQWEAVAPLKRGRRCPGVVAIGEKIYCIGGRDKTDYIGAWMEIYDSSSNSWTDGPEMPTRRERFAIAVLGNRIYAIGGYTKENPALDVVEYFDIEKNTWFVDTPIPFGARNRKAVTLGNKIYLLGGVSDNGLISVVHFGCFNTAPVVSVNQHYTVNEGDSIPLSVLGYDPEGDPLTYSWDLDNDGIFETPGQTVIFSAANVDGPAIFTASVKASDGSLETVGFTTITVMNIAPQIGYVMGPVDPASVESEVCITAEFMDPGILDTHTAMLDWGDGIQSAGIVEQFNGSGIVTGSHIYTTAGVYAVTLSVTDDDGDSDHILYQYVVVYDPTAGFVTGGGWIDSPEGAYLPDPQLTGKANFGFVSKYKKGATEPTGQTEFNFNVANMNFHSTSYQWLVISGSKAKYKGEGTINGQGEYGFMLTAKDGQYDGGTGEDLFRIKIWEKASGMVVYDNQIGDDDDVDASQVIGGGNIVIHSGSDKGKGEVDQDVKTSLELPSEFSLSQNYPNPFNPSTSISFALPVSETVQLTIYNIRGERIRVLVNEHRIAGAHSVQWDGKDQNGWEVAGGIYLCRIQTQSFNQTIRMLFVK